MKYLLFDKTPEWEIMYHGNFDTRNSSVLENLLHGKNCEKFDLKKHTSVTSKAIQNDKNHFILESEGTKYIWQFKGIARDINGVDIPNCCMVRKIGVFVV